MLTLSSFQLIFSLLLAVSISSSSLAKPSPEQSEQPANSQPSPEQPVNSQNDTDQSVNNRLQPDTVIIQNPNNQPFIIKNQSDNSSWIIPIVSTLIGGLASFFGSLILTNRQLHQQEESVQKQLDKQEKVANDQLIKELDAQRELTKNELDAQRELTQEQIKSQDKLAEEQNKIQERAREIEKYRQQLVNTFEMMKEWDSESMRTVRYEVYHKHILNKEGTEEKATQNILPFSKLSLEDKTSAIRIPEFFDRLDFLKTNEMIEEKKAYDYFSKDYVYWESQYFSVQRKMLEGNKIYNEVFEKQCTWLFKKE